MGYFTGGIDGHLHFDIRVAGNEAAHVLGNGGRSLVNRPRAGVAGCLAHGIGCEWLRRRFGGGRLIGKGGLAGFPHMLLAVRQQAWGTAGEACLASRYATQVPDRANRTASMLENGTWPVGYDG